MAADGDAAARAAEAEAAGRRGSQKAATRNRVIAAARELFETLGYPAATIRDIARRADVSVGSVFTTFSSKGEILSQVMAERLEALYAELDRVAPHLRGSTVDRLRSIFALFFAFEAPRAKLFLAHIAAAFDWTLPPAAMPYGRNPRLIGIIRECLAKGVEAGDVAAGADLDQIIDLLLAAYGWTYRLVASEGADARRLTEVMDRQIAAVARGFEPRG